MPCKAFFLKLLHCQINNGLLWRQLGFQFLIVKQKEVFEKLHILSSWPLDMHSLETILQFLSFIIQQFLFPISLFLLKSELFLLLIESCLSFLFSLHRSLYLLPDSFFLSLAMLFSVAVQLVIHSFDSTMFKANLLFAIFLCSFLISFVFFIFSNLYGILYWKLQ